jgi:hypothetical protein
MKTFRNRLAQDGRNGCQSGASRPRRVQTCTRREAAFRHQGAAGRYSLAGRALFSDDTNLPGNECGKRLPPVGIEVQTVLRA